MLADMVVPPPLLAKHYSFDDYSMAATILQGHIICVRPNFPSSQIETSEQRVPKAIPNQVTLTHPTMSSLTNINASDSASTSTPVDNDARTIRKDSARPRLTLHLNPQKRKEAEAAARSLQRAGAHLERYRQALNGHAATESEITQPLIKTARAAIKTFNRISHTGDRAKKIYESAKRGFDETMRLMLIDLQKLLDVKIQEQCIAGPMQGYQ
jgi:hypothetical protein